MTTDTATYSQPDGMAGFQFAVGIQASLDTISGTLARQERDWAKLNSQIYPVPQIPLGQITAASGEGSVLDVPGLNGPRTGITWFVTRITAVGFTAGVVNVYYDNANGTAALTVSSSGTILLNASQFPVTMGQRLVFAAGTGFAGTATVELGVISVADEKVAAYLL